MRRAPFAVGCVPAAISAWAPWETPWRGCNGQGTTCIRRGFYSSLHATRYTHMATETLSDKIARGFDKVLGIVTRLVQRNPRKASVVILGLVALVVLT